MKNLGKVCVVVIGMTASMVSEGIVFSTMWNWFIFPLGVPAITFWPAVGIAMTIGLIMPYPKTDKDMQLSDALKETVSKCVLKFTVLAIGAMVHSFV